jgi:hypothetical protein
MGSRGRKIIVQGRLGQKVILYLKNNLNARKGVGERLEVWLKY